MKPDGDEPLAETRPAESSQAEPAARGPADVPGPSPADPTRTSQPDPLAASPARADRPPMGQLRDHDRYDIRGEHGRGGLGRVSRAHDRDLGRDIAIKELISRGVLSEVRFLREALITARLEHPGIVPVYEAGRWPDGTPFYAMKLVAGRPLRDLIAERKTVDERLALLHHVIAVADAIAYAHGKWVQGLPDGNILSLSTDGTIARTGHDATSTVLARGVNSRGGGVSYSIALHILAYICEPMNLCLLDVLHEKAAALPSGIRDNRIIGLDFSADGKQEDSR